MDETRCMEHERRLQNIEEKLNGKFDRVWSKLDEVSGRVEYMRGRLTGVVATIMIVFTIVNGLLMYLIKSGG